MSQTINRTKKRDTLLNESTDKEKKRTKNSVKYHLIRLEWNLCSSVFVSLGCHCFYLFDCVSFSVFHCKRLQCEVVFFLSRVRVTGQKRGKKIVIQFAVCSLDDHVVHKLFWNYVDYTIFCKLYSHHWKCREVLGREKYNNNNCKSLWYNGWNGNIIIRTCMRREFCVFMSTLYCWWWCFAR